MNNKTLIFVLLGLGVSGIVIFFLLKDNEEGEKTYRLSNGVEGTAQELAAQGYVPVMVGDTLTWVSKQQYDQANQQSGGNNQKLVNILNASSAILSIVSGAVQNR